MRLLFHDPADAMNGPDVRAWQEFLVRQLSVTWQPNGRFGQKTHDATVAFQTREGLEANGRVGAETAARAAQLGFVEPAGGASPGANGAHPAANGGDPSLTRPDFDAPSAAFIEANFGGRFDYRDIPNKDEIQIIGGWEQRNIEMVEVPQLRGIPLYSLGNPQKSGGRMRFNRRGSEQLRALWRAWDDAGLVGRILTYEGAFEPRYQRRSQKRRYVDLSNHAYGTAFDINRVWNDLGDPPAAMGAQGSLRELVPIANQFGFHWGGHYHGRKDGMHFELARLL